MKKLLCACLLIALLCDVLAIGACPVLAEGEPLESPSLQSVDAIEAIEELPDQSDELNLDIPLEDVIEALEMRGAASPVSLDSMPQEDDDAAPLSNFFGVSEQGYIEFERNDMLRRAMSTLNEQHRDVIRMRYFENRSQREVAEELGVSQMWVSRAERKALELMKEMISGPED